MSNRERVLETIRKVKSLAERGVGGEKSTAQTMLEDMMSKYSITWEELEEDTKKEREFKAANGAEVSLIRHVAMQIVRLSELKHRGGHVMKKKVKLMLTDVEFLKIQSMLKYYMRHMRKERKKYMDGFIGGYIHKNDLYTNSTFADEGGNGKVTKKDIEEQRRRMLIAESIEKGNYRVPVEGKRISLEKF